MGPPRSRPPTPFRSPRSCPILSRPASASGARADGARASATPPRARLWRTRESPSVHAGPSSGVRRAREEVAPPGWRSPWSPPRRRSGSPRRSRSVPAADGAPRRPSSGRAPGAAAHTWPLPRSFPPPASTSTSRLDVRRPRPMPRQRPPPPWASSEASTRAAIAHEPAAEERRRARRPRRGLYGPLDLHGPHRAPRPSLRRRTPAEPRRRAEGARPVPAPRVRSSRSSACTRSVCVARAEERSTRREAQRQHKRHGVPHHRRRRLGPGRLRVGRRAFGRQLHRERRARTGAFPAMELLTAHRDPVPFRQPVSRRTKHGGSEGATGSVGGARSRAVMPFSARAKEYLSPRPRDGSSDGGFFR